MLIDLLKDAVSLFVYIFICPFVKNRKAVLVYHSVGENIDKAADPHKLNVSTALFSSHMQEAAKNKARFTVTFDDSYENVYLNAFPIIKRHGLNSIIFVLTGYVDGKTSIDYFFGGGHSARPLSWGQVKEMHSYGIEIGSHSCTHKNMAGLDDETLGKETGLSKKRIDEMTGSCTRSFSYPFGHRHSFNERTERVLKNAGYEKIYTNMMGMDNSGQDPLRIRRIRIYSNDGIFRFKMKIAGAYNWVDLLKRQINHE